MYKCTVCEELFYSTVDCASHVEKVHPEHEPTACIQVQYRCDHCGRVFGHKRDVHNHTLREHGLQKPSLTEIPA